MKKLLIISACLISTVAYAQQAQPEITFKVTQPELDVISEGLQTQPFGKVAPLINKLREQFIAQQPKPVEAPKIEENK